MALHAQVGTRSNHLRNHGELLAQTGARENGRKWRDTIQRRGDEIVIGNGAADGVGVSLLEQTVMRLREQIL